MLENRKVIIDELINYGFKKVDNGYMYQTHIVDDQFLMQVTVTADGVFTTNVMDIATNDEYVLHLAETAGGPFVGTVRDEYQNVLNDIIENCTENDIFKAEQTKQIVDFIDNTYGDQLEFLWPKFPENAIFRNSQTKKWYAAILTVAKNVLSLPGTEKIEVIDLHMTAKRVNELVDHQNILPGYHMNKKYWITICLDGSVAIELIEDLIKESYALA